MPRHADCEHCGEHSAATSGAAPAGFPGGTCCGGSLRASASARRHTLVDACVGARQCLGEQRLVGSLDTAGARLASCSCSTHAVDHCCGRSESSPLRGSPHSHGRAGHGAPGAASVADLVVANA